jgi:cephalosporin hydroxylase
MTRLDVLYKANLERESDMKVHVPTLAALAKDKAILELGVRYGVSTAAFLYGRPRYMVSVDMNPFIYEESYIRIAMAEGIDWRFLQQDSRVPVPGYFDLVFIDTTHQYSHIKAELAVHTSPSVKYLVMHDTVCFGERGDVGWPGAVGTEPTGQMPAIREFLAERPEWMIQAHYDYPVTPGMTPEDHYRLGCGLMVLSR